MRTYIFRLVTFITHFITAQRNNKGYGVQSPFAFNLLNDAIHGAHSFYMFPVLRKKRAELLKDEKALNIEDFGAKGYRKFKRPLNAIVAKSVKPIKQQEILFRLANYMKAESILELGTSIGLTTAYLASANTKAQTVTIEACHDCALEAADLWKSLDIKNITLIQDTFENSLEKTLNRIKSVDFVFIDGNHKGEALERYFEQIKPYCATNTMIIVDDIYWSKDMQNAWKNIKQDSAVKVSFDLYYFGIFILNSDVTPGHYKALI